MRVELLLREGDRFRKAWEGRDADVTDVFPAAPYSGYDVPLALGSMIWRRSRDGPPLDGYAGRSVVPGDVLRVDGHTYIYGPLPGGVIEPLRDGEVWLAVMTALGVPVAPGPTLASTRRPRS